MVKNYNVFKYIPIIMGLLLGSCYDDLGNYDYQEINELTITLPEIVEVVVPNKDSVEVVLQPVVKQKAREDNGNLIYLWRKKEGSGSSVWKECGWDKDYSVWIKSRTTENISFRFAVTDTLLGITSYKEVTLKMENPLENTWFVLQNQSGKSVLGAVDGAGIGATVYQDIYQHLFGVGQELPGEPVALEVNPSLSPGKLETMTVIYLLTDEGGRMMNSRTLETIYDYNEMLLGLEGSAKPEFVKADQGELIIDDGKMWYATWSEYSIFYPIKLTTDLGADYYLTDALLLVDHQVIAYDSKKNCFLWYDRWDNPPTLYGETVRNGELQYYDVNGASNRACLKRIAEVPKFPNVFNPDTTGLKDILFMGTHSFMGLGASMKGMAVGRKEGAVQWHIYEFSNDGLYYGDRARCSGYYTFMPSVGDENSWCFASSCYFNNIFFYAAGNKVFRVDLNSFVPLETKIYEYPDPSSRITKMKFRHDRIAEMSLDWGSMVVTTEDQPYWLGLAVEHVDKTASLVEMRLKLSGEVLKEEGNPKIYEYKGFEGIVDIGYSFHPTN